MQFRVRLGWVICALFACALVAGAQTPVARKAVPDEKAQATADKLAREVYKDLYSARGADARGAVARRFMDEAGRMGNDLPARYVLLREARDAATDGGDLEAAFAAINATAATFDVDALAMKATLLAGQRGSGDAARSRAARWAEVADEAIKAERFDVATKATVGAEQALAVAGDPNATAELRKRVAALRQATVEAAGAQAALDKLARDPNDAESNLAAGRYYCFIRGDWAKGLPMLAKSSDAAVRAVAGKDLANPATADAAFEVAGAWWELADRPNFAPARRRAAFWYAKSTGGLSGIKKALAEKRVADAADAEPREVKKAQDPTIADAIRKGVAFVYTKQNGLGHWDLGAPEGGDEWDVKSGQYGGITSLVVCALLTAGEDPANNPKLRQAIDAMLKLRTTGVYAVSYRIQAMSLLDPVKYRAQLQADVNLMMQGAGNGGTYTYRLEKPAGTWDLSCTQYAWIGLAAAEKAGVKVPVHGWQTVASTLAKAQADDGGWRYAPNNTPPTLTMTCAGVTVLLMSRDKLSPSERALVDRSVKRGTDWIDDHLDLSGKKLPGTHPQYMVLGLQRVGQLGGRKELGKFDWFDTASRATVAAQRADGSWGWVQDTAMAMLFLSRGGAR